MHYQLRLSLRIYLFISFYNLQSFMGAICATFVFKNYWFACHKLYLYQSVLCLFFVNICDLLGVAFTVTIH